MAGAGAGLSWDLRKAGLRARREVTHFSSVSYGPRFYLAFLSPQLYIQLSFAADIGVARGSPVHAELPFPSYSAVRLNWDPARRRRRRRTYERVVFAGAGPVGCSGGALLLQDRRSVFLCARRVE